MFTSKTMRILSYIINLKKKKLRITPLTRIITTKLSEKCGNNSKSLNFIITIKYQIKQPYAK